MIYFNETVARGLKHQWLSLAIVFMILYTASTLAQHLRAAKVPLVGRRFFLEPQFVTNFRFFRHAGEVLGDGYDRFKHTTFKFIRADAEMLVLPAKYVNELRNLPSTIASPTLAHVHNLMGRHTNMDVILRNNLHFRTLQEKVTPNLGSVTVPMQEELNHALQHDFPNNEDEWVTIKPYHTILRLVSRLSARVFLGTPLCRNEQWLEISTEFTENVFISLVILRLFPMWLHDLISMILPSAWKGSAYVRQAKRLLIPEVKRRQQEINAGKQGSAEHRNILSWMIEIGKENEKQPADLAHLEVIMSLASIHTSQMNAVHVLYDLAAHPGYIQDLRAEIKQIINTDGPWMEWKKTSFSKLRLLDSFMKESQRLNPPTQLSYHRILLENHTLIDGTTLYKGSHVCMAVTAIQNDEAVTPDPSVFDGFRYYKMRQREDGGHLHQFATTEPTNLNFGHGKYACPGRFFAALEIKIILVRLIMDYDFKLKDGQIRPANLFAHEFIFPNPEGEFLVKRRQAEERLQLV
ncbi:hypothetical protein EAE96_001845 [Botrytis aclada]|nr:hypothetical protein EAE96_001845 [Botrytis aclada]